MRARVWFYSYLHDLLREMTPLVSADDVIDSPKGDAKDFAKFAKSQSTLAASPVGLSDHSDLKPVEFGIGVPFAHVVRHRAVAIFVG